MTSTFARCLRLFLLPLVALSLAGCAGGGAQTPTSSGYTDAMEIKLKCREMADQMLATMPNTALEGFVAMPTSFVNKNNTSQSSPLGRLLAESMYYEFNQRGFPTREYRLSGVVSSVGGKNDLALASSQLFVRASDGLVLRTAQLVLVNTPIVNRLLSDGPRDKEGNPIKPLYPPLYQPVNQGSLTITQGR